MGTTLYHDIPNVMFTLTGAVASVASNAADAVNQIIGRVESAGIFRAAYFMPSASQAGSASHYRTLKIVNLGSAAAGTVVLASYALSASTTSVVASTAKTLTNGAVLSLAASDLLAYVTTSTGNGIPINVGTVQIEYGIAQ